MKTSSLQRTLFVGLIGLLLGPGVANAAFTSVTQTGSNLDPIAPMIEANPLVNSLVVARPAWSEATIRAR